MTTSTWHGRRGPVLLGPTEARIARYLEHMTRRGRVAIRTVDLAAATQLERSEAYRITARLRVLGLFGIENDRGGTKGGRRYWRTPIEHDSPGLDATLHRVAWSRLVAWARVRRRSISARLATIRQSSGQAARALAAGATAGSAPLPPGMAEPAGTFAERMRRYGLGELMDSWRR